MKPFIIVIFISFSGLISIAQPVKIMVATSGHNDNSKSFIELIDSFEGVEYEVFIQPDANQKLAKDLAKDFDVLVFYDKWQDISDEEKRAYLQLTEKGKPFLFIHHSIASYQNWPEFEKLIGGKYFEKARDVSEELLSTKEEDVWLYANIENYTAVTVGFDQIRFFDEAYDNVRVSENVIPLLRTRHPKSIEFIAWQHKYKASDVVYIQPGFDYRTFESDDYRKLIKQAILFLAKKNL